MFFGLHVKTSHASTLTCFITGRIKEKLKLLGNSPRRKTESLFQVVHHYFSLIEADMSVVALFFLVDP